MRRPVVACLGTVSLTIAFCALGSLGPYGAGAEGAGLLGPPFSRVATASAVPPDVYAGEEGVMLFAGVGEVFTYSGTMYDPDSSSFDGVARFGDGAQQVFPLEPAPDAPSPGWYLWTWNHAWSAAGLYSVEVDVTDAEANQDIEVVSMFVGESPFSDVSLSHPFFPAIAHLWDLGVVGGYADGTYGLYDPVVRAQISKMVVVAFGLHDAPITNLMSPSFTDVVYDGDPYPFDYVEEAAENLLVSGYSDGTFRPWNHLSRIALVRILVRAAGSALAAPPPSYELPFTDVGGSDAFYVGLAHYNGLVNGTSATTFSPYATATRGHVAEILWNALAL